MQSCMEGIGVSCPKRFANIWSSDSPTKMSDPSVWRGCDWVRKVALERKWSPPISLGFFASAGSMSVSLMIVRYLRKGSRGLSALGDRSKSRPVCAGDQ